MSAWHHCFLSFYSLVIVSHCPHFWCSHCSDLASGNPFRLLSVSFCHVPILPWTFSCIRSILYISHASPRISHFSRDPHPPPPASIDQMLYCLWLGSNSACWVTGPHFPKGFPPYPTQALTVPAGPSSPCLGWYLTLDHTNTWMALPLLWLTLSTSGIRATLWLM